MASLATVENLFILLGRPLPGNTTADYKRAELILNLASDWAREFARKTWLTAGDAPPTVSGLVLAGARREFVNPKRVTYEVKGPESASYDRAAYPPGFFTEAEEARLCKYHSTGSLWTQGTYRDLYEETDGWLEILPTGGYMKVYAGSDPGSEEAYHL